MIANHESTHQYLHHAMEATSPDRILTQGSEFRAMMAWIAMQEVSTSDIPPLVLQYSANRLIGKLLSRAAIDHDLPWGKALMQVATER
jgi:hypothetical protein